MKDWDAVVAHTLTLPGVEVGTSYGKPAVKMRGKAIAATTAPDPGSFVLHVHEDDKELLIETDPDTFWETNHYHGWPAVLVRYGTEAGDRIATLIERGWWDRASARQRAAWGNRP